MPQTSFKRKPPLAYTNRQTNCKVEQKLHISLKSRCGFPVLKPSIKRFNSKLKMRELIQTMQNEIPYLVGDFRPLFTIVLAATGLHAHYRAHELIYFYLCNLISDTENVGLTLWQTSSRRAPMPTPFCRFNPA